MIPVIYENNEIMIVNKPAGISSQGGERVSRSLDEMLSLQTGRKIFLVHRLDKETSGLMIVAKDSSSAAKWIRLIAQNAVKKEYTAVCFGAPTLNNREIQSGMISLPILKNGKFQSAKTSFSVKKSVLLACPKEGGGAADLKKGDIFLKHGEKQIRFSIINFVLLTGRTHQIRIHAAKSGFPVAGDDKYGDFYLNKLAKKHFFVKGLQLAATKLTLNVKGKSPLEFKIEPEENMRSVLNLL